MTSGESGVVEVANRPGALGGAPCETFLDHAVALGEWNVLFARRVAEDSIRAARRQTDYRLASMQRIFELAERQQDILEAVVEGTTRLYLDMLLTPFYRHESAPGSQDEYRYHRSKVVPLRAGNRRMPG